MAANATVFKATLNIADMDRHYYADFHLTLAQHPSETDERLMVRLLAFMLYADERLHFGKGLCVDDEADLWQKDLTGAVERWIMVGLPDEKHIRKACGRASQVVVITYGRTVDVWWQPHAGKLPRMSQLTVLQLPAEATRQLASLCRRTMQLQCNIQDQILSVSSEDGVVEVPLKVLCGKYQPAAN